MTYTQAAPNLFFFRVCLSYIHTSYLFYSYALRVLLLLLSSLFCVVIGCHCLGFFCVLIFSYFFSFYIHCSILGMTTILIDGVHQVIAIKLTLHNNMCLVFKLTLYLSIAFSIFVFLVFFYLISFFLLRVYLVCMSSEL